MKKVYVAQAYGGKKENEEKAHNIVGKLNEVYPHITFLSPVLAFGDCYTHMDYEEGFKKCLALLDQCDEVLMLDGWEESEGATREKQYAESKNIPVLLQSEYPIEKPMIVCLMGFQASGKDTLATLLSEFLGWNKCVSDTTRKPRPGEVDTVDYYFISHQDFSKYKMESDYIETSGTGDNKYGLSKSEIKKGVNLFVCDPNGYEQIKRNFDGKVISVYIQADEFDRMLRRTARERGITEEEWNKREYEDKEKFRLVLADKVLWNRSLKTAYAELRDYIKGVVNEG